MNDVISRQWLIECVNEGWIKFDTEKDENRFIHLVRDIAPSAQPEQCDDAVSRHRLLNDLEELTTAWEKYPVMAEQIKGVEAAIGYVKSIPSVQPETHEERTETHTCDLISRQAAIDAIKTWGLIDGLSEGQAIEILADEEKLPSAHPKIIRCRDCRHFEYDHPYIIQGVPVLGHEVCNAWGDGCKTDENGYCFLAERRTDEGD